MPEQDITYSGSALAANRLALQTVIKAFGSKSVLEIGTSLAKDRRLYLPDDLLWFGAQAKPSALGDIPDLAGPYDLIIVTSWLSTLSLADRKTALGALRRKAKNTLFVHEPRVASNVAWDRVDWTEAIGGSKYRQHVLSSPPTSPASYLVCEPGANVWRIVSYN